MKKMLIEMILDELPSEVINLKKAATAGNLDSIHKVSHKLKSTLSYVGSLEMTSINNEIETSSKSNGDINHLRPLTMQLDDVHHEVLEELKRVVATL